MCENTWLCAWYHKRAICSYGSKSRSLDLKDLLIHTHNHVIVLYWDSFCAKKRFKVVSGREAKVAKLNLGGRANTRGSAQRGTQMRAVNKSTVVVPKTEPLEVCCLFVNQTHSTLSAGIRGELLLPALFGLPACHWLPRGQSPPLIAETDNCALLIWSPAHTSEAFQRGGREWKTHSAREPLTECSLNTLVQFKWKGRYQLLMCHTRLPRGCRGAEWQRDCGGYSGWKWVSSLRIRPAAHVFVLASDSFFFFFTLDVKWQHVARGWTSAQIWTAPTQQPSLKIAPRQCLNLLDLVKSWWKERKKKQTFVGL